jgi:23S rRNA pseudouridine1911/1915/1917 synthase
VRETIPGPLDGERLDRVVALLTGLPRAQVAELVAAGAVRVGGAVVPARSRRVAAGETVEVDLPARPAADERPAPDPGVELSVVHADEHVIVVDKPAGLVVHPGAGHPDGTLVNGLLARFGDLAAVGEPHRPGIVHRLDRGTSGVMVVAKHDRAHEALARQFHDREVDKDYLALVWGAVHAGRRIDAPIGRDPGNRQKMSARARRARSAVTRITRVEPLRGVSFAQIAIATGRTHQIRVHLSAIGHPIVGDALYGGVRRHVPADLRPVLRLERPFLHAARIAFTHPGDGRRLEFVTPLPADLQAVLDDIRERQGAAAE